MLKQLRPLLLYLHENVHLQTGRISTSGMEGCDPIVFEGQYRENSWIYALGHNGALQEMATGNPLITSPMTSCDPKRSRSWPRYRKMQISRKRWEIEARYQLTTNRKCHMWNRMDTWPMTSREVKRSRSWPYYVWGPISQKRLEIRTWSQWSTYRKWPLGNPLVTSPMTSRDSKRSRSGPRYRQMQKSRKRWNRGSISINH